MRPVLVDNAFEAWTAAIRYCNDIKDGKATLQYQKNFVSSLHNAVELIMKQMMLNSNDHRVAFIKKPKDEIEERLLFDYTKATDLNRFFGMLSGDEISKFQTIKFNKLINLHKDLFGNSLNKGESLSSELKLLQRLRNNKTHFMIQQGSFLSEEDFHVLHNFMLRFYKIIKKWYPKGGDDIELSLFLWWDCFNPDKDDDSYEFYCEPLQEFSYRTAVKNSKLANDIAELLKSEYIYGAPDFSPYTIAKELADTDSASQVKRYIRLTNLIPRLLALVDSGKIALGPAVELSYLSQGHQNFLAEAIEKELATPSLAQTQKLKKLEQEGKLDVGTILSMVKQPKPNQVITVKIPDDKISKYMKSNATVKEKEDFLAKAVEYYGKHLMRQKDRGAR